MKNQVCYFFAAKVSIKSQEVVMLAKADTKFHLEKQCFDETIRTEESNHNNYLSDKSRGNFHKPQ